MSNIEFGAVGQTKPTTFSNLKVASMKEEQTATSQKKDTVSISDEAKGLAAKEAPNALKDFGTQFMGDKGVGNGSGSMVQNLLGKV